MTDAIRRPRRLAALPYSQRLLLGAVVLTLAACASAPEPREQLAVARAAVEQAGSHALDAPQQLATARDKLNRAERAATQKDYRLARLLADEAAADAEMAQAAARSERAQRALVELRQSIQQLRRQIDAS